MGLEFARVTVSPQKLLGYDVSFLPPSSVDLPSAAAMAAEGGPAYFGIACAHLSNVAMTLAVSIAAKQLHRPHGHSPGLVSLICVHIRGPDRGPIVDAAEDGGLRLRVKVLV